MAMTGVLRPGHVELRVLNLEEAVHHYRDLMGLEETGRDSKGRVYLKCWDELDHHSVVLQQSDRAGIDHVAFKVLDKKTLEQFDRDLQAYGVATTRVPAGEHLETGERVRFQVPTGHTVDLYAEKKFLGNGCGRVNPRPWSEGSVRGMAPFRLDHCLLYGPNVAATQKLFTEVLGFNVVEQIRSPDGESNLVVFLSCSIKSHDIAFGDFPESGKLHHCSFAMKSWDHVLRAGDIMSMNKIPVDIGPTRHGVTRGATIYAWDPSGNRFEVFKEDHTPYPDHEPLTWTFEAMGEGGGLDYIQRKLHETFLTVVS